MVSNWNFVLPTSEQVAFVREELGTTEADVRQAVQSLREWLEMQPHLPKEIEDARIETTYINCKCSMERTKQGLDAYFSLKQRLPELLMNRDPLGPDVLQTKENIKMIVMPQLTKHGHRVFINTHINPDASKFHFGTHVKMVGMELEILQKEDYSLGDILIVNLENVTPGHVVRVDINTMKAAENFYKTAFCRRIKGIHIMNAPKIIDTILTLVKSAVSEKIGKRIHVHLPGSTTLFDYVEREYIPDELGGTAGPLESFNYQLFNKAIDLRDWFLEQDKYVSDESKRPPDSKFTPDIFGAAGSFKKLNVD